MIILWPSFVYSSCSSVFDQNNWFVKQTKTLEQKLPTLLSWGIIENPRELIIWLSSSSSTSATSHHGSRLYSFLTLTDDLGTHTPSPGGSSYYYSIPHLPLIFSLLTHWFTLSREITIAPPSHHPTPCWMDTDNNHHHRASRRLRH